MTEPTLVVGLVQSVSIVPLGDELATAAVTGATTVTVDNPVDFDPDGGTLSINGTQYGYTAVDEDTGVITLATGLVADGAQGDRVDVWDTGLDATAVEYRALVELPGVLNGGDPIDAAVAAPVAALLPEGIRDPGTGESVTVELVAGEWTVTDVRGKLPQLQGSLIAPASIPQGALGFTLPGGTHVTVSDTAPTSPNDGDLWVETNAADPTQNTLRQWHADTSSWEPVQFGTGSLAEGSITTELLAAGAIVAEKLAAGLVVAGIVDATTITGATLVATGTSGSILAYSGTPAAGNLVLAVSPASGTDDFGNDYGIGLTLPGFLAGTSLAGNIRFPIGSIAGGISGSHMGTTPDIWVLGIDGPADSDNLPTDVIPELALGYSIDANTDDGFSFASIQADKVAIGSIISNTSSDYWADLEPGSVLLDVTGLAHPGLKVGSGPQGRYYYERVSMGAQSIPSSTSTFTLLKLFTVQRAYSDYATAWGVAADGSGIWTCPEKGIYTVTFSSAYAAWVSGSWHSAIITLNGNATANQIAKYDSDAISNDGHTHLSLTRDFVAGDTLQFGLAQTSGATQTITVGSRGYISVRRCL